MSGAEPENFKDLTPSDMRLLGRGIRGGWKMPDGIMEWAPQQAFSIAKSGTRREQLAAMTLLRQMALDNRSKKAKRKPPQILPVVMTEGNVDDLRRQLIGRANKLGFNGGGDTGTASPVG